MKKLSLSFRHRVMLSLVGLMTAGIALVVALAFHFMHIRVERYLADRLARTMAALEEARADAAAKRVAAVVAATRKSDVRALTRARTEPAPEQTAADRRHDLSCSDFAVLSTTGRTLAWEGPHRAILGPLVDKLAAARPREPKRQTVLAHGEGLDIALAPINESGAILGYLVVADHLDKAAAQAYARAIGARVQIVSDGRVLADSLAEVRPGASWRHGVVPLAKSLDLHALIDTREATDLVDPIRHAILLIGFCAILAAAAGSVFLVRFVLRPLVDMAARFTDIAAGEGDLTQRVEVTSDDEIGQLGTSFNTFLEVIQQSLQTVGKTSATLADSSDRLARYSREMSASIRDMSQDSRSVADAGEQLSSTIATLASGSKNIVESVQSISASTDEMVATINQVARHCEDESKIAKDGTREAGVVEEIMTRLGDSAQEISKVTEVISRISSQTNLLALNATIEAAAAGEAGKGFAVVATEVKALARQSAQASQQIAAQITDMQKNVSNAISENSRITAVITDIDRISQTIATAVEQQQSATDEIAHNLTAVSSEINLMAMSVDESANNAKDVSAGYSSINQAAQQTTQNVVKNNQRAAELAAMAEDLQQVVARFNT